MAWAIVLSVSARAHVVCLSRRPRPRPLRPKPRPLFLGYGAALL